MKPERILVPLDVAKCPREVFKVVNGFAQRPGVTVLLLHVVNLNIAAPENRVYAELGRSADGHLKRLAEHYVNPRTPARTLVRFGNPAEEVVAAAKEENADLIILPRSRAPFWRRLFAPFLPKIVVQVIREAPCGVFVMDVQTRLDCNHPWPSPVTDIRPAVESVAGSSETERSASPSQSHSVATV